MSQNSARPPALKSTDGPSRSTRPWRRAAELLAAARFPLVYGLSRSSTEGQRAAVRLAELIGATIDTTASRGHGPSVMAVQQVGESTCSLGEVKNRCDLVIFWGCDPVESHPRHLERYAADCAGLFTPRGRRDRTLVAVDVQPTATSRESDLFIPIESGAGLRVVVGVAALVRGLPLESEASAACRGP